MYTAQKEIESKKYRSIFGEYLIYWRKEEENVIASSNSLVDFHETYKNRASSIYKSINLNLIIRIVTIYNQSPLVSSKIFHRQDERTWIIFISVSSIRGLRPLSNHLNGFMSSSCTMRIHLNSWKEARSRFHSIFVPDV